MSPGSQTVCVCVQLRMLVQAGVPMHLRGELWMLFLGTKHPPVAGHYKQLVQDSLGPGALTPHLRTTLTSLSYTARDTARLAHFTSGPHSHKRSPSLPTNVGKRAPPPQDRSSATARLESAVGAAASGSGQNSPKIESDASGPIVPEPLATGSGPPGGMPARRDDPAASLPSLQMTVRLPARCQTTCSTF